MQMLEIRITAETLSRGESSYEEIGICRLVLLGLKPHELGGMVFGFPRPKGRGNSHFEFWIANCGIPSVSICVNLCVSVVLL